MKGTYSYFFYNKLKEINYFFHLSQILKIQTADDFYCKMESFSAKLLSGTLIESNNLIQRISDLGKIPDLQKMRDKQLKKNLAFKDKKGAK